MTDLAGLHRLALGIRSLVAIFCCTLIGCGGGSAGNAGGAAPPPQPLFIEIDGFNAGQNSRLGTTTTAINANGDIVGTVFNFMNNRSAFVRAAGGTPTTFNAPGAGGGSGEGTSAEAINASGTIVGWVSPGTLSFFDGYTRDTAGVFTTFDVPTGVGTIALAVNDSGVVTGFFQDGSGFEHGFIRAANGTFTTFDGPGTVFAPGKGTIPARINAAGAVVGTFQGAGGVLHGFLRAPDGTMTVLDAPGAGGGAGLGTQANAINASGVIVGTVADASAHHSFMRDANGAYTVFDPPGIGVPAPGNTTTGSIATAVNDQGLVAGYDTDSSGVMHGYIRNPDGTVVLVDDPLASVSGPQALGTMVNDINRSGFVVGTYFDQVQGMHGFARE